ncbi:hypothetical protein [Enterovirga rhinocerotis]|uniref:Uncharacterized protein n=1 Tax=Enterovirga rhinocerotis TaxID=1339210 RepID=A0A4R7BWK2_9HYPH|nr:hypothetical protein [Enterovirga rhinocerotis]TDR90260.1 hypothetical protein EV668_3102 [Enterovirga rhinocerotis]
MTSLTYLNKLSRHLAYLFACAKQVNELDFAASLSGEFRGMQDPGWSTTITAHEVFREISSCAEQGRARSKAEIRVLLFLYCQLAEAGGVYETIKNVMGIITLKPYLLWPFHDLVKVRTAPQRIIGPNANATFRNLAKTANEIGMTELSSILEGAFRDDIRNGIYHADYVIWEDGLRLRRRNGGLATRLTFEEVNLALTKGIGFFDVLRIYVSNSISSFHPSRTIVGRLSENFPATWTVHANPASGAFSISSSSPGPETSPEFLRQEAINGQLGGKVFSVIWDITAEQPSEFIDYMLDSGFSPHEVALPKVRMAQLLEQIELDDLWDHRFEQPARRRALLLSPWGFRYLSEPVEFGSLLDIPSIELDDGIVGAPDNPDSGQP